MSKGDCNIYGDDDNGFAEGIASASLNPSKGAFNASASEGRKPGKTSSPVHTDHRASETTEPTVRSTRLGIGDDARKGSKGN